jgi:uncharacterized membrane protein YwzB
MAKKNKTNKKKVSNIMLVVVCVMIFLYTVASFILQYFTSVEISPTLTSAWFTFWAVELFALAGIRVSKVIKGEDSAQG